MPQKIDLTGKIMGRLTVLSPAPTINKRTKWHCLCSCGKKCIIRTYALMTGHTHSCGCYVSEATRERSTKHGGTKNGIQSKDYRIWLGIKNRCFNRNHTSFKWYGSVGVLMHPEWVASYPIFMEYINKTLGPRPTTKHTLDRIDPAKGYFPGNLRWASIHEQARNHKKGIYHTIKPSSVFKGVHYDKTRNKWVAQIVAYKYKFLGRFGTEIEAAKAYNKAATKLHGEFACINKIPK